MSDPVAQITLTQEIVNEWPEEVRPANFESIAFQTGIDPVFGPFIGAELGENRTFVIMVLTNSASVFDADIDDFVVKPYKLSNEANQSLLEPSLKVLRNTVGRIDQAIASEEEKRAEEIREAIEAEHREN